MADLPTNAERLADQSRGLPAFRSISLPDIRARVAEMLHLIGRVEGLFSSYTLHDISHIDAMLKMLDWLVPTSTARIMTPADWLISVLSIYLHDLGMIVTTEEFEERSSNPFFVNWLEKLGGDNDGREFLARTHGMSEAERERFLFQEFVRSGHAARIREWISGRHSRRWGAQASAIAESVADLLKPLPSRFREYLGNICESHHSDNLHRKDLFPLSAPFGNEQSELANVQFAALLLRTTDLLHVTKDRTPSASYKSIRLSDPKAVEEWNKQSGVFVVRPVGRELVEGNSDTAVIAVYADFTEERPLFALQEYIAYAHEQVQQSKRWADKSQEDLDARLYSFPWHSVVSDVRLEGVPPHPLRFDLDRGKLLDLLVGHTIYNDPTIAVRELLQNAIDAVRYQHYIDAREARAGGVTPPLMGTVSVNWQSANRRLVVEDDGTGMDWDIIVHNLMRVGSSYYNTAQFQGEHGDFTPISRFGIGILTCFMISDDVEIITCRRGKGYRIRMTSVHSDYLLRELQAGDHLLEGIEPHGTRVSLALRPNIDVSKRSVLDIVRYWVIIPECRVRFAEGEGEPIFIGFGSTSEALAYYQRGETGGAGGVNSSSFEVIEKRSGDGRYELAFVVRIGVGSERSFVDRRDSRQPAVCIEGIRVSDTLPWFRGSMSAYSEQSVLAALLCVRGDRSLRTTVSRSGLEVDEEFHKIGQLCSEILFSHIRDETLRIASMPGHPLSRASTAARWLLTDLERAATDRRALTSLESLFQNLSCMVVEKSSTEQGSNTPQRYMISPARLADETFWSVESRLIDYLGVISRDLGKELSLNEFMAALAPEFTQLRYSPLIPDAHLFRTIIRRTHVPERTEISEQHQQTAIKWIPSCGTVSEASIDVGEILGDLGYARRAFHDRRILDVDIAPLTGDEALAQGASSRTGIILKEGSALASLWLNLKRILKSLAEENDKPATEAMLMLAQDLISALGNDFGNADKWRGRVLEARPFLARNGIDLPDDLWELRKEYPVFVATAYWKDWSKRGWE